MSCRRFFSRVLFCISILFSSIAPSLGMDVPLNVNNNNNVLPKGKEEATEEVPLNLNNDNNVPLEEGVDSTKNGEQMIFSRFEDGSRVQLRTLGKSGHPKVEIKDIVKNIEEKITFK